MKKQWDKHSRLLPEGMYTAKIFSESNCIKNKYIQVYICTGNIIYVIFPINSNSRNRA